MDTLYHTLKFVHIATAIVWLGGLFALGVIAARFARADAASFAAVRRASQFFGQAVVGPAALVTLIAGVVMAGRAGFGFGSVWIVRGFVGIFASILLGALPIRLAGNAADALYATAPNDGRLPALQSRLTWLSALNLVILLSVVWAMVFKP